MNEPMERGVPVNANRFNRWLARFTGYRAPVTNRMIELWLEQFTPAHQDIAARVLDAVLFIGTQQIHTHLRQLVDALEGFDKVKARRHGRWFFVPFSGSTGESGDTMLHQLRMAASMTKKQYNELFIHRSELVTAKPGPADTVVLVDDFSGTATQATTSWQIFEELLTGGCKIVLMLIAATEMALDEIREKTEMEPVCAITLGSNCNIFHSDCRYFNGGEKNVILTYCETANRREPRGYGNSGLLVVFAHRTPNDSIPILHRTHAGWQALFPR